MCLAFRSQAIKTGNSLPKQRLGSLRSEGGKANVGWKEYHCLDEQLDLDGSNLQAVEARNGN